MTLRDVFSVYFLLNHPVYNDERGTMYITCDHVGLIGMLLGVFRRCGSDAVHPDMDQGSIWVSEIDMKPGIQFADEEKERLVVEPPSNVSVHFSPHDPDVIPMRHPAASAAGSSTQLYDVDFHASLGSCYPAPETGAVGVHYRPGLDRQLSSYSNPEYGDPPSYAESISTSQSTIAELSQATRHSHQEVHSTTTPKRLESTHKQATDHNCPSKAQTGRGSFETFPGPSCRY